MDSSASIAYLEHLSYLGVFLAMATTGYLVPLPEEVILLVGGFLIASHVSNLWVMLVVSILGGIAGDTFMYYISHHGSKFAQKLKLKVEKGKFGRYTKWFRHNAPRAIFLTRFIPGMRFLSPVMSGILNIPSRTFIFYDALAALIFIPLVTAIGYFFHNEIDGTLAWFIFLRHSALMFSLVVGISVCSFFFVRAMLKRGA